MAGPLHRHLGTSIAGGLQLGSVCGKHTVLVRKFWESLEVAVLENFVVQIHQRDGSGQNGTVPSWLEPESVR